MSRAPDCRFLQLDRTQWRQILIGLNHAVLFLTDTFNREDLPDANAMEMECIPCSMVDGLSQRD